MAKQKIVKPENIIIVDPIPGVSGVCKDCGNGTLNNDLNPAFVYVEDDYNSFIACKRCGSTQRL